MIKSVYTNQHECLRAIQELHCPEGFECDLTYGNGAFYKEIKRPRLCYDLNPKNVDIIQADSTHIPLSDNYLSNVVVDLPFLPYIRVNKHKAIMAKRFSGYWHYKELEEAYEKTLKEVARVLKPKGILVFKCQDIIYNHKFTPTHCKTIKWASKYGLRLKDMFILVATHRMPVKAAPHGRQKQQHARVFHSYFLIFEKQK